MIAGPFAEVLPYCYEFFAIEALAYWNNLYTQMNSDFSILIQAFLFTQMGNALKYRTAIDHIDDNNQNQTYAANFNEYGNIVNLIFLQIRPFDDEIPPAP